MTELLHPLKRLARFAADTVHRRIVYPYLTSGPAQVDREVAHERALVAMEWAQSHDSVMTMLEFTKFEDPALHTKLAGITLSNPLGFAAGFDKNGRVHELLGKGLGFGLVTVGSITKIPYAGNPRPRIFDLPASDGIINRMGFPGDGSNEAEKRLATDIPEERNYCLVINIAASKPSFVRGAAIEDYVAVASQLLPYGDIHEINVSSPNTPGVRGLQEPEVFADLAAGLRDVYTRQNGQTIVPHSFKFGPDLPLTTLERDLRTAIDNGAAAVTVTNTSTDIKIRNRLNEGDKHREQMGGISGVPLREKALQVSHQAFKYTGGEIDIIRAGGVKTVEDVWEALTFGGATVVEVYSAFVRATSSTPNFATNILTNLVGALKEQGMTSVDDLKAYKGEYLPFPNQFR